MNRSILGALSPCPKKQRRVPIGRLSVKSRRRADTEAVKRD